MMWYDDEDNVRLLIDHLIEECYIGDCWEDIRYVLEKPYKWRDQWDEMHRMLVKGK
jgi:hypothetical protein